MVERLLIFFFVKKLDVDKILAVRLERLFWA